jgi:hypothetical protein
MLHLRRFDKGPGLVASSMRTGRRASFAVLALSSIFLASAAGPSPDPGAPSPEPCEAHVGLNHFYFVLDEETYAAVRSSDFILREFAKVDAGLPAFLEQDPASERLFVRGKHTYLELFRPDNRFGEPVGKVGIALGGDRMEDLDCVQRLWSDRLEGDAERTHVERRTDGDPVPWYDAVYRSATSNNSSLVLWAAGYRPEFLPWLYPHRSVEQNGVARADFLAPRFAPDRLLEDIVGLVVAAPEDFRLEIARQLEAIGYRRVSEGDRLVLEGGGWSLTLVGNTESRRGLLAVHFATTREAGAPDSIRLGLRSILRFGPGRRAVWYFE